jgi:hypothetical protein
MRLATLNTCGVRGDRGAHPTVLREGFAALATYIPENRSSVDPDLPFRDIDHVLTTDRPARVTTMDLSSTSTPTRRRWKGGVRWEP